MSETNDMGSGALAFAEYLAERLNASTIIRLGYGSAPGPNAPLAKDGIFVCCTISELPVPERLLGALRDFLRYARAAIVTMPQGVLSQFENFLRDCFLVPEFIGFASNGAGSPEKSSILAVLRPNCTNNFPGVPTQYRIVAFMHAYNEEDIIAATLEYLTAQGVDVHVIDNWSTDRTVERAQAFLDRGVIDITRFPAAGPSATFDLYAQLRHTEQLSHACNADWCIHHDTDEIRESPWPQLSLREALYHVDREGFNAVDHTVITFHPVMTASGAVSVSNGKVDDLSWFDFGNRRGHFEQIKAWKPQRIPARLAESGGHQAEFPGRRVYPFKFLLRHYPIRSQEHGARKILMERQARWNPQERAERHWHRQYDHIASGHNFLRNKSELIEFNRETFYSEFLVERLSGIGIAKAG